MVGRSVQYAGFAALLLAGATAGSWLWLRSAPDDGGARPNASSTLPDDPRWPMGEARTFDLTLSSRVTLDASASILDVSLRATWTLTRLSPPAVASPALPTLVLASTVTVKDLELPSAPEHADALKRALAVPAKLELGPRALIEKVGFAESSGDPAVAAVAEGLLRTLFSSVQLAAPPSPDAETWTSREKDPAGTYAARYDRPSATVVIKEKQQYLQVRRRAPSAMPGLDAVTTIDRSAARFELKDAHVGLASLEAARIDEQTRAESTGPMPALGATLAVTIEARDGEILSAAQQAELSRLLAAAPMKSLDEPAAAADPADPPALDAALPALLADLQLAEENEDGATSTRSKAFATLSRHLRTGGEDVEEVTALIRSGHPLESQLIDALGSAGSADAQTALRGLLADGVLDEDGRRRALLGLSLGEAPAAETVGFLQDLRGDAELGRQAKYGLGSAAYHLRDRSPEQARRLVESLAADLAAAETLDDTLSYLRALGNAGHPATLDILEPYLMSDSALVRSVATEALRRIPGRLADQHLARALQHDLEAAVRRSSLRGMADRDPSPVLAYAVRHAAVHDAHEGVRREAVHLAIRWTPRAPFLRDTVAYVAQHDASASVRGLALRAL